jgi:ribosome-binding factor A
MASSRRIARVASLIQREVGQMLFDGIKDDRVGAGMVSVTDVEVSGDLQHAKIFVSIYGTEEARSETMAGLRSSTAFVRRELGQRIRLRRTPAVVFYEDRSLECGTRTLATIERLQRQREAQQPAEEAEADRDGTAG